MRPMSATPEAGPGLFDRPYLLLTLTSLFWASNLVIGRYAAPDIPPLAFAFLRWAGAALIVLPFAWKGLRSNWPVIRRNLPILIFLSATGIGPYNALSYWALAHTEAINAVLVQSTAPLLIAIWCFVLWGDRLTLAQFGGILVSLLGVLVIVTRGVPAHLAALSFNIGDMIIILALVLYGLYSAALRKRPALDQLSFLASIVVCGTVLLLPFAAAEFIAGGRINFTPSTFAVLGYVMLFPSLIAYLFFNRGVQLIGANRAGPFFHLMPVFGSILAILFLGEEMHLFHIVGFLLVLGGVFVATTRRSAPAQ